MERFFEASARGDVTDAYSAHTHFLDGAKSTPIQAADGVYDLNSTGFHCNSPTLIVCGAATPTVTVPSPWDPPVHWSPPQS